MSPRREQSRNVPVAAAVSLLGVPKKRSFPFIDIEDGLDFYPAGLGDDFWVGNDTPTLASLSDRVLPLELIPAWFHSFTEGCKAALNELPSLLGHGGYRSPTESALASCDGMCRGGCGASPAAILDLIWRISPKPLY